MNSKSFPGRSTPLQPYTGLSPADLLAKMPRKPLTAEQQLAALDKVQAQATQRIKLGQQLFKAAEARLTQHQDVLDKIRNQQQDLRDQVQEDVAKSLQTYDQWMGKIDESFTTAIRKVTERLDQLEADQHAAKQEVQGMVARATALMEQTQRLMMEAFEQEIPETNVGMDLSSDVPDATGPNELESAMIQEFLPDAEDSDGDPWPDEQPPLAKIDPPMDDAELQDDAPGEDVFGKVLQRLRDAEDEDQDQAAA